MKPTINSNYSHVLAPRVMRLISRAILAIALSLSIAYAASASTIAITSIVDADSASDGVCTLREAILTVNSGAQHNECAIVGTGTPGIVFQIPGAPDDIHTITLIGPLPTILQPVQIDGTTQGSSTCVGIGGVPDLRLVIRDTAGSMSGLMVGTTAAGSSIKGVTLNGFVQAIVLAGNSNVVACDIFGTDAHGLENGPGNAVGVDVQGSDNLIGVADATQWLPNLFGFNLTAIKIETQANAKRTRVVGNRIGIDATGTATMFGDIGIDVGGTDTWIGDGAGSGLGRHQRNIFGLAPLQQSSSVGIRIRADRTVVAGNYFGLEPDGHSPITDHTGIAIDAQANTIRIGCDEVGDRDDCRNVIAGQLVGIKITGAPDVGNNVAVIGNSVGFDAAGESLHDTTQGTVALQVSGPVAALVAWNALDAPVDIAFVGSSAGFPTFANATNAGFSTIPLDSIDNCVEGGSVGVEISSSDQSTPGSTPFSRNWWGAVSGPSGAGGGSGTAVAPSVAYQPFSTTRSIYCRPNGIFSDGYERIPD